MSVSEQEMIRELVMDGLSERSARLIATALSAPAAGASSPVLHYQFTSLDASASFLGLKGLTAVDGAPLTTPTQTEWDTVIGDGFTTGAVPALTAGSYQMMLALVSVTNGTSGDDGLSIWTGTADSPYAPYLWDELIDIHNLSPLVVLPTDNWLATFASFNAGQAGRLLSGHLFAQKLN